MILYLPENLATDTTLAGYMSFRTTMREVGMGMPIPGYEAPASVLRGLRDSGIISNAEYKRMLKGR